VDVESPGVRFAAGAAECVDRRADLDIPEPDRFENLLPACTRQATADSSGP